LAVISRLSYRLLVSLEDDPERASALRMPGCCSDTAGFSDGQICVFCLIFWLGIGLYLLLLYRESKR
jgi:hypothetical protein